MMLRSLSKSFFRKKSLTMVVCCFLLMVSMWEMSLAQTGAGQDGGTDSRKEKPPPYIGSGLPPLISERRLARLLCGIIKDYPCPARAQKRGGRSLPKLPKKQTVKQAAVVARRR